MFGIGAFGLGGSSLGNVGGQGMGRSLLNPNGEDQNGTVMSGGGMDVAATYDAMNRKATDYWKNPGANPVGGWGGGD